MSISNTVRTAALSIAAAFATTASVAAVELKLADFLPPNHPYQEQVYGVLGEKIAAATNGEVTLKVFPGGALGGNPVEQYNRALNGVADISFSLPGYTASLFPMTLLTELPGLVTEENATRKLLDNLSFIEGEYQRVHLLGIWTNGENVLYTKDKPVRSLADVQGMKIRVPSSNAGLVVESWGASPVSMPVSDIYNALQTGVLDAILIDSTSTYAFRLGEVANYVTAGMNASISPFVLFMNKDSYMSLSPEQRTAIDEIGKEVSVIANEVQLAGTKRGEQMFKEMEGKEWIDLTPEAAQEFNEASAPVVDKVVSELESRGLDAEEFAAALKVE